MTSDPGSTGYQNILEMVMCVIISSLSIYAQKNTPQIVRSVQGGFRMFLHVDRVLLDA